MESQTFNGIWLSKEILNIRELSIKEKMILALSINLYKAGKKCFVSNKTFSNLIDVNLNRVSRLISSLKNKGYIRVKIKYKENSKQIEAREIIPVVEKINGSCPNAQEGIIQKDIVSIDEKCKDINNNIKNNYKKIFQPNNKFIPYKNQTYADLNWDEFYAN